MCFSENQSYINALLLSLTAFYIGVENWRLSIPLIYLATKDILQGLLYRYYVNKKLSNILGILSWIHICYHPLIINLFISHFDKDNKDYWNLIFIITFIFGTFKLTKLSVFDIQNDPDCNDPNNDFCAKYNGAYICNYHLGYKFKAEDEAYNLSFIILMVLPGLLTKVWPLSLLWLIFIIILKIIFYDIGRGERGAIWCFLSIVLAIPIAIFRKRISKLL